MSETIPTTQSTTRDIHNFRSIFTLTVFLLANANVALPFSIHFPSGSSRSSPKPSPSSMTRTSTRSARWIVPFDFRTTPIIAVLLLLATQCISGEVIGTAILGSGGIEPLDILALFISLAYIAVSLDQTGLFRFLALWVSQKGGRSGRKLFTYLYALFFSVGVLVGNDPIILSGTPFLAYYCEAAKIDPPTAWIFAEFSVCNVASAVLVSSNPTNLVVTGAFSISFFRYSANVIIPTIIGALALFPTLLLLFRKPKYIPKTIEPVTLDPKVALKDRWGAVFGSLIMLVTLVTLVATSFLHPPVWMITVPPALIILARDVYMDLRYRQHRDETSDPIALNALDQSIQVPQNNMPIEKLETTTGQNPIERLQSTIAKRFPTCLAIAQRMPWLLVPFALAMFILVQSLVYTGWIDVWTVWWTTWVRHTGMVGSVFGMGVVSALACNVFGTNIGATILLARILQRWIEYQSPSERTKQGAIFALALGTNFGAFSFSFSASLAGLLWRGILLDKGIRVKALQFFKLNLLLIGVVTVVSCAVLVGQMAIIVN